MTNTKTGERRAVLWDVDGTLIDSSEYHWLSWHDALAAENFPITREQFAATFGQRNDEILRAYFPGHTPDDIQSGAGVVHNAFLFDHPEKSVVHAPFVMKPTPAWFARMRSVPRWNGSASVETSCGVSSSRPGTTA